MYQLMLNRKNSKKGFTLVEIIVVLVILAILAALLIPAMTGWIDKAKEKQAYVEARTYLLAAQTLASEAYGTGKATATLENIIALSGLTQGVGGVVSKPTSVTISEKGVVTQLVVTGGPKTLTYNATGENIGWSES